MQYLLYMQGHGATEGIIIEHVHGSRPMWVGRRVLGPGWGEANYDLGLSDSDPADADLISWGNPPVIYLVGCLSGRQQSDLSMECRALSYQLPDGVRRKPRLHSYTSHEVQLFKFERQVYNAQYLESLTIIVKYYNLMFISASCIRKRSMPAAGSN